MKKTTAYSELEKTTDVVPAFLSTSHILRHANDEPLILSDPLPQEEKPPSDFVIRECVRLAAHNNHMDLFIQPIVTLPQRRVQFYEMYGRLRIKPGLYVPARDYMRMANEASLMGHLDAIVLARGLKAMERGLQRYDLGVSYFINIRPFTLRNQAFMEQLLSLLSRHHEVARALIFEMRYSDLLMLSPVEQKIMSRLAQIGCRFSVDHVDDIPTNVAFLRRRSVAYVKIGASDLLRLGRSERGFSDVLTRKHNLEVNGIDLIVEKVERHKSLLEVLDYDIKYGQGFLLGRPDFQGVYL